MAEYKLIEDTSNDAVANPADGAAEKRQAELPGVESVSILSAMETTAEPIVEERRGEPIATAFNKAEASVAVASGQETAPAPAPEIVAPAPTPSAPSSAPAP